MRYLLDTCIFIDFVNDFDSLDKNVASILSDKENVLCVSAETGKELVVGYNNRKFFFKIWKTSNDIIQSMEKNFGIKILPVDKNVINTYSKLEINTNQDHKDPSDHIIISHAITAKIPLITNDRKFQFYRNQGLDLILNAK